MSRCPAPLLALALVAAACGDDPDSGACLSAAAARSDTPAGQLVWQQAYTADMWDEARAIAVDPCSGRVAVGGSIDAYDVAGPDMWIGALSHDGTPQWDRRIHEKFGESAEALAFAGDGSLIVAGVTDLGPYSGSSNRGGWLARLDGDYAEQWRVRLTGDEDNTAIKFVSLALTPEGHLFTVGSRHTWGRSAALAALYDPDGTVLWTHAPDSEGGHRLLRGALVLPDGDLLAVGWYSAFNDLTESGVLLVRLGPDGTPVSEQILTDLAGDPAAAPLFGDPSSAIRATDPPSLLLAFTMPAWFGEVSLTGTLLRETWLAADESPEAIAVGQDGDLYLAGHVRAAGTDKHPWIARFDADHTRVWSHVSERAGSLAAVSVGPGGDAFVVGSVLAPSIGDFDNRDFWIARIARGGPQ